MVKKKVIAKVANLGHELNQVGEVIEMDLKADEFKTLEADGLIEMIEEKKVAKKSTK